MTGENQTRESDSRPPLTPPCQARSPRQWHSGATLAYRLPGTSQYSGRVRTKFLLTKWFPYPRHSPRPTVRFDLAVKSQKVDAMPGQIVVIHDDVEFLKENVTTLQYAGYAVVAFTNSMTATDALLSSHIELLITRVRFPGNRPNGVALGRMARIKRPGQGSLHILSRCPRAYRRRGRTPAKAVQSGRTAGCRRANVGSVSVPRLLGTSRHSGRCAFSSRQ